MRRLNITPAEMESVCGRMVACRAAEHLGLNINQFYYIAKKLSLKTAFVKPRWSDDEDKKDAGAYLIRLYTKKCSKNSRAK